MHNVPGTTDSWAGTALAPEGENGCQPSSVLTGERTDATGTAQTSLSTKKGGRPLCKEISAALTATYIQLLLVFLNKNIGLSQECLAA